ncbi:MAG: carbamoyl-phosphate synthase large subunit [Christensenellaceae bacterium]|nr:carbamoyl-phosphate synthase large subunit [Christensenellaceae bacterium]
MPLNPELHKVMIIGSGPIVIGQAAEFDYAGSQACRALKDAGLEVVLVNPNPATIMTDHSSADHIYIEPLTLETLRRIILKEKPDSLLSTLGGQSGLTLSMQLAKEGFLEQHGVKLLGARCETIEKAEDRQQFKDTMQAIHQPVIPSEVVENVEDALAFAETIGYPVIVRPAYTLGGSGGGICKDENELREIAENGLRLSPITQILVEKCISGWKEIEFEVMRDKLGNVIAVCSMENIDPVGVHTGDSIVVAPALTLADKEYQMLRRAALDIITALEVEGGCNCQFALNPDSFEYAVIEVNPRVSRSSALASKATGYPIAKCAAQIAIGFTLDEMKNAVTGKTCACFEPALDYIVAKVPKWPFDKFVYGKRTLGTQMKATGEVMSIGVSVEQALMKAVRGAEIGCDTLRMKAMAELDTDALLDLIAQCTDQRMFAVYEAMSRGVTLEQLHEITKIDYFFLHKFQNLLEMENRLRQGGIDEETYLAAKRMGYPDKAIERLSGEKAPLHRDPVYKMVDTCAAEFAAETPYFYATYDEENEASEFLEQREEKKPCVVVLGSGPIRIGQGIEFDYASVHCVWMLKQAGYDVVMINNNPETVSTDFDTADRLYFEPLTPEDVLGVIATEKPVGVVAAFGGQTAIKLTHALQEAGVRILGTSADAIDAAEDRERFDAAMERHGIKRPKGMTVLTCDEALKAANELGYPVLVRPSYVLGGQNMIIAYQDSDIVEYMKIILDQGIENPILIDQYLMGIEAEADAICDGEEVLIPGIMEHVERSGVHSGDSIAVYPAWNLTGAMTQRLIEVTRLIAIELGTVGLINIQYIVYHNEVYVIEANPRASRTVPYISKVTGVPMVDLAVRAMLGEKIRDMGYGTGLYRQSPYYAVKVPCFSFEKLADVDTHLGPEMKSTGEVLGLGANLQEAIYKGLVAAGFRMRHKGGLLISVRDKDKEEVVDVARKFAELGFNLFATPGTAKTLIAHGLYAATVQREAAERLLEMDQAHYVISTSNKGRSPLLESVRLRRKAVERGIPLFTSLDTAEALVDALTSRYSLLSVELVDINNMRKQPKKLRFVKMRGTGNDYLYFDCFEQEVESARSLAVRLSNRRTGIGSDGIVLILPSTRADARMRMFNADGSEGAIAGNALRCVAKYLYESGRVRKDTMLLETETGVKSAQLFIREDEVFSVLVDMGYPAFRPEEVPVKLDGDRVMMRPVKLGGKIREISCVSMGNPHVVIFVEDVNRIPLSEVGPIIEQDPMFPQRVNVSFAQIIDRSSIRMRVWERGIGETAACGTGACAVAVAAVENDLCNRGADIDLHLPGGTLVVRYAADGQVWLTGDAVTDFEGTVRI